MSYEICVLDPQIAVTREAAFNAWNDGVYIDNSLPDTDRGAPKWRFREALSVHEPKLEWREPKSRAGLLAALMGKETPARVALFADLSEGDESISFYVYDQAIEIDLPWSPDSEKIETIVRDLWRQLEKLSQLGLAIYDTERDVMLNLETDFDAVLKRYIENVKEENEEDKTAPQETQTTKPAPFALPDANAGASRTADASFTGNAGDSKPWWKVW